MMTITASNARTKLELLIDQVSLSRRPVRIAGRRASAVLVSADEWRAIQETLYLLSVPGMGESIRAGRAEPLELSAQRLEW